MTQKAKIIIIITSVFSGLIILLAGAFAALGFYIQNNQVAMPNVRIEWVNVSGLTYYEALSVLRVLDNEQRKENASVTVMFPDGSEITITGKDANLRSDARDVAARAVNFGYGRGFFADTLTFLSRYFENIEEFQVTLDVDEDYINHNAKQFVERFNREFGAMTPSVNDEYIVVTLGAGHTNACADDVSTLIFDGLYKSFETGEPVVIEYSPPDSPDFRLVAEMERLWQNTRVLPKNALYDRETRTISEGVVGVSFDFAKAVETIRSTDVGEPAIIEFIIIEPEISKEYLESFLFIDVIGEETTIVAGSADRLHNIILAAEAIHGYVLEPGEEFSFNRIVGRRTREAGFRAAPVIVGGQFVPGLGGGICQVSSTLYSAIRDTNFQVTERRAHSRPITYLPRGRDAAVAWGIIDFRFINNTERPIRIDFEIYDRRLTARVEGTLPDGWEPSIRNRPR